MKFSSCSLIPIRFDVWSADKQFRILDTLLLDPYCWPLPFTGSSESLEANVQHLAQMCCADAEVIGMGRTVRHFTNRIDLTTAQTTTTTTTSSSTVPYLQEQIANQIRPQLEQAAIAIQTTARHIKGKRSFHPQRQQKLLEEDPERKRIKASTETETETSDAAAVASPTPKPDFSALPPLDIDTVLQDMKSAVESSCSCIHLRLSANGVRLHDDFYWDNATTPSSSSSIFPDTSPLLVAEAIGHDLNLPDEMVMAVATDIAEQVHGLVVGDPTTERDCANQNKDDDEEYYVLTTTSSQQHGNKIKETTAAWLLDSRVHVSNVSQLVQLHRN